MNNRSRNLSLLMALFITLSLLLSSAPALAASFTASDAGIRYRGSYKLGSTGAGWKRTLGKYTRKKYDGCTVGTDSYMYTFKSRGVKVETLVAKTGGSEQIISIIVSKKTVPTLAGLKVGNTVERMEELYGTKYKKSGSTYKYTSGNCIMSVKVKAKTGAISKITFVKDI